MIWTGYVQHDFNIRTSWPWCIYRSIFSYTKWVTWGVLIVILWCYSCGWQDIKFPMILDVYDLCTPDLQKRLQPMRDRIKEQDDKNVEMVSDVPMCVVSTRTCLFRPGNVLIYSISRNDMYVCIIRDVLDVHRSAIYECIWNWLDRAKCWNEFKVLAILAWCLCNADKLHFKSRLFQELVPIMRNFGTVVMTDWVKMVNSAHLHARRVCWCSP